jgi:GNAT superfamily N-acetyltransferase
MRLEPASRWSHAELAEIFNAGYEGYFTPFVLDEAAFRFMVETYDDDLDASRVALVDDEPAGICKLAIRGDQGWIAGVGVAPPHRGTGVGKALMRAAIEQARGRGIRDLWLEVLVQNEPAIGLYEQLGFDRVRGLEVWTLGGLVLQKHKVRSVAVAAVHDRIRSERTWREPWQRADASVANQDGVEAVETADAAALYRRSGDRLTLLQVAAANEESAIELIRSLPQAASLTWLNGPEGDIVNAALAALGGTLAHRQHEMSLRL